MVLPIHASTQRLSFDRLVLAFHSVVEFFCEANKVVSLENLVHVVALKLRLSVRMICPDVLFKPLKTWVDLYLARLNIVKLAVFQDVGGSAGVTWKFFWPEVSPYAQVCVVTSCHDHFTCIFKARKWIGSNFSC